MDVPDPAVHTVEIDPSEAALEVGDTIRLTATAKSVDGETVGGLDVTWSSLTEAQAAVTPRGAQGHVLATAAGVAVISATIGGKTGRAEIEISNPAPRLTSLSPDSVVAGQAAFSLVITGEGFVPGSTVHWNGAARTTTYVGRTELRAFIAAGDVATAGTAEVRVVSPTPGGGPSEALPISIQQGPPPATGPVASVKITVDSLALGEGDALQLTAVAKDTHGRVVPGRYVAWSSSDPELVVVDPLGEAVGVRTGYVMISARVDGVSTSIPARVTADYAYDLVFPGWDGVDLGSVRTYRTDFANPQQAAIRIGPDAPTSGAVPSPDGQRIAYLLLMELGSRRLMVANRDGSQAKEIHYSTDTACGRFTWSPDSRKLAFSCRIGDQDPDIWVVDANGQNLLNVTGGHPGKQEWPSWSPYLADGSSRIAYAQFVNGEPQIWTMKPDGTDARQLTGGMDHQPAWSPDGTTIAFQRTSAGIFGDIWMVDANGGNERGVRGFLAGPQEAPAWSPDGRLLAFVSTHETYGTGAPLRHHIYTVWADGTKLARRTTKDLDVGAPAWSVR